MISDREALDINYKILVTHLSKYEDNNIEYYTDSEITKRCLTHPSMGDMKDKIDDTYKQWKNPFKDAYIWLKGELLDIKSIADALYGREHVVK